MSGVNEEGTPFKGKVPDQRFRRFGPFGPAYEVVAVFGENVRVRVVESGEELDYPRERYLQDPEA